MDEANGATDSWGYSHEHLGLTTQLKELEGHVASHFSLTGAQDGCTTERDIRRVALRLCLTTDVSLWLLLKRAYRDSLLVHLYYSILFLCQPSLTWCLQDVPHHKSLSSPASVQLVVKLAGDSRICSRNVSGGQQVEEDCYR